MALVLKTSVGKTTGGSNPPPVAIIQEIENMKKRSNEENILDVSLKDALEKIVKECVIKNIKTLLDNGSIDLEDYNTYFTMHDSIIIEQPAVNYTTKRHITIRKEFDISVQIALDEIVPDKGH